MRLISLILLAVGSALAALDNYKTLGSYYVVNVVPQSQFQLYGMSMACFATCTSLASGCMLVAVDSSSTWCSLYSTSSVAGSVYLAPSTNTTVWKKQGSSIPPLYAWTTSYDSSLANYWPIQSSTALDLIKSKHMNSSNPVWVTNRFGVANSALRINSSVPNDDFSIPSGQYLNGGGSYSVVMWIRMVGLCPHYMRVVEIEDSFTNDSFRLNLEKDTCKPFVQVHVNGVNIALNNPAWVSSHNLTEYWSQVAVTFESTSRQVQIFINATQTTTVIASLPLNNVTHNRNFLGSSYTSNEPLDAEIDELKLYNRALSQADLASDLSKADSYLIQL